MKLYVDANGDRHYLVTDDGESVYVDELEEEGRVTGHLEQTIEAATRRGKSTRAMRRAGLPEVEGYAPD